MVFRRALDGLVAWTCRRAGLVYFSSVEVEGLDRCPAGGPALMVANHHNAVIDAMLLLGFLPLRPRFLGASTMWGNPALVPLLAFAGVIPVRRRQDTRSADNASMVSKVHDALGRGSTIALFPEGETHDEPRLLAIKSGAAHMALDAMVRGGARDLKVVPVGLHYDRKDVFRSRALLVVGHPIDPSSEAARAASDRPGAIRSLTGRIERTMRRVGPDYANWREERLIAQAAAVLGQPAGRGSGFGGRVAARRALVRAYRRARIASPDRVRTAERRVERYSRLLAVLRVRDRQVAADPSVFDAAAFAGRAAAAIGLVLPLAVPGIVLNFVPYRLCALAARGTSERDVVSTYKLVGALILYPACWAAEAGLAGWIGGWVASIAVLAAGPVLGYAAVRWLEVWERLADEARAWFVLRSGGRARRVLLARQLLHAEIADLAGEAGAAGRVR